MKKNILEYFIRTVEISPQKTAVIEENNHISFFDLNNRSKDLAGKICQAINWNFNRPVAVFLPKTIDSIVADIAITYSGNIYMNLDIKSPSLRLANILELIKPELVITCEKHTDIIKDCNLLIPILLIENINVQYNNSDGFIEERLAGMIDTDPLCIINTSGSTGTPKGVVLNHRSFIDFTEWAIETLIISEYEVIGSLSPLVFDIYSFELCMLMAKGSTIVLLPESFSPFPAKILNLVQEKHITFLFWVPTIMVNIANMDLLRKITLPELKTVWFAGEVFPTKQFNYWRRHLSGIKFVNLYGPIEITLDCTYFIVDREIPDHEPIPIGFPCRNTDILILNDKSEIARKNEEGELCVRGTSLAMGYYNNPEMTAAAFVQNPLNIAYPEIIYRTGDIVFKNGFDEIVFKGRKDSLVKHMGYRIELLEIEHVIINTLKLVENGCIVYNRNKKVITLFYENQAPVSIAEVKKSIGEILPKYMIPTVFHQLDVLPRNVNGKIDRLQLDKIVNNG